MAAIAAFAASVVVIQLAAGPHVRTAAAPGCPGQVLGQGAGLARVGALGPALSVIELAESTLQRPPPVDDPDRLALASARPFPC